MFDVRLALPLAGLAGLMAGSFLNVCIYRWPRDLSVVRPRSKCPACEKQIAWYDNVPVLSYLILGGRCRACASRIPWRYPAVELVTAAAFAFFTARLGSSLAAGKYCIFSAILIALAFSDAETRILPDELTLGGTLIGFVFAFWVPVPDSSFHALVTATAGREPGLRAGSLGEAALGAFVCSGLIYLAGWLFEKIRRKQGLGLGDVKMLAMAGAFLGLQSALLTVILGSLIGSITGLAYIRFTGKDAASYPLPFGTFLAVAAMLVAIEGQSVIGWYDRTLR